MKLACLGRALVTSGLFVLAANGADAQGLVSGTVLDSASGRSITGAAVRIESLGRETVTDRAGRFTMVGVPAGEHEMVTRYLGFVPARVRVTVVDGQSASVTLRLGSAVTELGTVVVTAARTGQAAALNQQQNAANLTNVVAADQIGRFPDANIGDALKRLPGITVALDQGEARFASIRGTEPRFNSVMINGERLPSAEAEIRQVQLDLIPSDMVQAIEVNKTLTPEMDADAIGGSVNVVTRAAPAGFRLSSTLGTGYNWIRDKPVAVGSAVAGGRFLEDRAGIIASASYYNHDFGSDNKEGVWSRTDDGRAYIEEFDTRRYDVQRIRRSLSGGFDYRLSDHSTLTIRSILNSRSDWENRFRARYILGEPDAQGVQNTEIRRQTKGGGPGSDNARLEDQRTQSHQLTGEHLLGSATLSWAASIASAFEKRPDERYIDWRVRNVGMRGNYSDEQTPLFDPVNPALVEPSRFTLRRIEQAESFTEDRDRNARIDLLLPIGSGSGSTWLKLGARLRGKDKVRENSYNFATPTTSLGNLAALPNADYTVKDNLAGPYRYGVFTTPEQLAAFDLFDPARFTLADQPGEYAAGNFDASEGIAAAYVQLNRQFTASLGVIAGVRVERTNVDYSGYEFNIDDESVSRTSGSRNYTDVLPSVNVRWGLSPTTVLRMAVTTSMARPNYFDLVPYREVSLEDEELATGNPDLAPTRSTNLDLSVERYFSSVGLLSAGVFHKNITDFIFHFTQFSATDPVSGAVFSTITQPRNGAEARVTGAEFALQRQLDFLPGMLRYVGVYLNYTWNDSRVKGLDIDGREGEKLPLLGTARHSANGSLSFDAPRVSIRLAINHQSESLDAGEGGYNEDAFFDRWADRRTDIDANGSVQLSQRLRFFIEANNLNDRPLRFYQGVRGRLMQDEFYGRRVQTGLKFDY